jgi:hypothetical protein
MRLNRLVPFRLRAEAYYMGGGDAGNGKGNVIAYALHCMQPSLPPSLLIKND